MAKGHDDMTDDATKIAPLEDRIRAIEDHLQIYNLIASHPPSADTAAQSYIRDIFLEDAVLDLGGSKTASGNTTISEMSQRDAHQAAIAGGLAHFAGLPHVKLDGDYAVVTSYLQILTPHPSAEDVEVPAHGVSKGFRIHRVRSQPVGAGADGAGLENQAPHVSHARRIAARTRHPSSGAAESLRRSCASEAHSDRRPLTPPRQDEWRGAGREAQDCAEHRRHGHRPRRPVRQQSKYLTKTHRRNAGRTTHARSRSGEMRDRADRAGLRIRQRDALRNGDEEAGDESSNGVMCPDNKLVDGSIFSIVVESSGR